MEQTHKTNLKHVLCAILFLIKASKELGQPGCPCVRPHIISGRPRHAISTALIIILYRQIVIKMVHRIRCVYIYKTLLQVHMAQCIQYTCYLSINFPNRNGMDPVWHKLIVENNVLTLT